MVNLNMPMMASTAYATSTHNLAGLGSFGQETAATDALGHPIASPARANLFRILDKQFDKQQEQFMPNSPRRLVKVVIVDPNENVPLEQCLLYSGDEKLTDATDQELFFEIDIKSVLDKHNETRVKIRDKRVKERDEFLEPAKIRDLKMVVVNIATF